MSVVAHYEDFTAIHDHMPGSDGALRVSGTVVCRTDGCTAELRDYEGNPGINPRMLVLELALSGPEGGAAEVLTPIPVEYVLSEPGLEYEQVEFRVSGTDDEPPPVVEVQHPQ
ncbi:hypothetical protein DVA67_012485 [Solirubrobacter sp. CPCC 204708]|uniref:Uncharacterized protein n=1 Tax=Solirubrobacter deserti TaxID=2282478 RepID=A0ABT4RKF1_9ACTN|nr:hypothetical protein [Solirubrobacter deserti]MBE2316793.1 hypothetical protein [Solirubrobacter deserti]MDA0138992.1 hypothetical protein [Solirubrobacter deserti]